MREFCRGLNHVGLRNCVTQNVSHFLHRYLLSDGRALWKCRIYLRITSEPLTFLFRESIKVLDYFLCGVDGIENIFNILHFRRDIST